MKLFTFVLFAGVITVKGYSSENYTVYPTQSSDTLKQVELFGETYELDLELTMVILETIKKDVCATSMDYFFDGYVLDTYGFERLQKLSPQCRKIPCDLINHVIDNMSQGLDSFDGIDKVYDLFSKIQENLQPIYTDYFCPCGVQLFDWIVESAKFYDGNVLYSSFDEDTILAIYRFTRYVDSDSLKRFLQRATKHLCAKRTNRVCIDDIMQALKYIGLTIDNTIELYDGHDNLTYSEKEKLMRQCDNFLHLTDAISEIEDAYEFDDAAEEIAKMLNMAYCKQGCKKEISYMYPCCLRDALNDKKLFKYGEDFGLSLYNLFMLHYEYELNGYFELDAIDDMREIVTEYTEMPSEYKDLLYRVIHPAKYCRKKEKPSCS